METVVALKGLTWLFAGMFCLCSIAFLHVLMRGVEKPPYARPYKRLSQVPFHRRMSMLRGMALSGMAALLFASTWTIYTTQTANVRTWMIYAMLLSLIMAIYLPIVVQHRLWRCPHCEMELPTQGVSGGKFHSYLPRIVHICPNCRLNFLTGEHQVELSKAQRRNLKRRQGRYNGM